MATLGISASAAANDDPTSRCEPATASVGSAQICRYPSECIRSVDLFGDHVLVFPDGAACGREVNDCVLEQDFLARTQPTVLDDFLCVSTVGKAAGAAVGLPVKSPIA